MSIEVRNNMNGITSESFIHTQKIDAASAFERLAVTRKMAKEFKAAINATNTVDIAGEHKTLYDEFDRITQMICLKEQELILAGE